MILPLIRSDYNLYTYIHIYHKYKNTKIYIYYYNIIYNNIHTEKHIYYIYINKIKNSLVIVFFVFFVFGF